MIKLQNKQIFRIGLLSSTFISLFYVPWVLVWAWIVPLPDTIQEQVNQAIPHGFEGIIVYVDEAGESSLYASGWHDRENQTAANPKALFKIASISKLYVAVAISQLVQDKRLSLDKTLAVYFPELVGRIENIEKITLRHMVQHRSGIPNYTDTPDFWSNPPLGFRDTLNLALDLPANFLPDKGYGYSNTNYLLIAQLIDNELGYSLDQYIKENILTPLSLTHTFSSLDEVNIDDVMSGYHIGHDEDLKADEWGMLATAEDVGIFLRALNDGSVFAEGEQLIYSSIYEYQHTGWVPGYQSMASYHKDIDTVVIQFTNTTGGYNWNSAEIVNNRIIKIIRNRERVNQ